ncbi:MAG: hypothetical protein U5L03_01330 [Burkholderiaceae bacterium]|nr:hypothetical protein [Burkholderiaceae bacterium]
MLAKHGPVVFGTPLQAAPQCDQSGPARSGAANNAAGSDRLTIGVFQVPAADQYIDSKRREKREGVSFTDEPSLGKGASLERRDKGREAVFHMADNKRYVAVMIRARDGLNDAYIERARAFAKVVKAAR